MNKQLTLGSLFDGSGGFPIAGLLAGIKPVWESEIEPFPIRVTTKQMPYVKHYGDISKINGATIEPVDIITFGSPCQDLSVAGKRAGLVGNRSSLFYEAMRIVQEMRCETNGQYPRYIVWENVPGAFSSNKGEDFRCVLEAICQIKDETFVVPRCDKWMQSGHIMGCDFSVAWRVLDAQYWGVPQRRKRIFLVADFGGKCADKILFESEGLSGYSKEGFRTWQRTACRFESSTYATGYDGYNGKLTGDCSSTLGVNCGMSTGRNGIVLNDQGGMRMDITDNITSPLRAEAHHPPCVMDSAGFCTEHSSNARSVGYEKEKAPTLRAGAVPATVYENHGKDARFKGPLDISPTISATFGTGGNNQPFVVDDEHTTFYDVRFTSEGTKNARQNCYQTDVARTIDTGGNAPDSNQGGVAVVYGICSQNSNSMKSDNPESGIYKADTSRTLDANGGNPSCNQGGMAVCVQGSAIGRKDENGPKGSGINEDVCFTLNATDKHAVVYALDRETFNCGKNYARKLGITDDGVTSTLNAQGPSAVAEPYSFYPQMKAECQSVRKGTANTIVNGTNPGYQNGVIEPTYSSNKASFFTKSEKEKTGPLVATDYKDPPLVNNTGDGVYTVRRLTPTECARLQGFPDWWCQNLGTEAPSTEDIKFWYDVFETHRKATEPNKKPKSLKQVIKWLKDPHSDSAEYKMWGNGVALPCVWFVLSGIVWYTQNET